MNKKMYVTVTGVILGLVSLAHLARLSFGVAVSVGSYLVPMWVSVGGFLVAGGIAVWAIRLRSHHNSSS